jgi:hypothetical protein
VDEGQVAIFDLVTKNLVVGTAVPYTISGVSSSDVVGRQLSGSVNVGANGQTTISISITADSLSEGQETLTLTTQGKSASVAIKDTSTSPSIPPKDWVLYGDRYIRLTPAGSWQEAESYANSLGGNLFTIRSETDN